MCTGPERPSGRVESCVVVRRIDRGRRAGVDVTGCAIANGTGAEDEIMPLR
jgi:hypothetical protein